MTIGKEIGQVVTWLVRKLLDRNEMNFEELIATNKKLLEWLRSAEHKYGCATFGTAQDPLRFFPIINPSPCTCGLSDLLKLTEKNHRKEQD